MFKGSVTHGNGGGSFRCKTKPANSAGFFVLGKPFPDVNFNPWRAMICLLLRLKPNRKPPLRPVFSKASRSPHGCARATSTNTPAVSYTHLRAHETVLDLVCRLLL